MHDTSKALLPLAAICLCVATTPLRAQEKPVDKYRVTKAEKAACTADAIRLCMDAYPSEDKLLYCMKANRASLSATCRVAFDAGLKRRRL